MLFLGQAQRHFCHYKDARAKEVLPLDLHTQLPSLLHAVILDPLSRVAQRLPALSHKSSLKKIQVESSN